MLNYLLLAAERSIHLFGETPSPSSLPPISQFYIFYTSTRLSKIQLPFLGSYKCFWVDTHYIDAAESIHDKLQRDIKAFLADNAAKFSGYDRVKVYYDNGQDQVKKVLEESFAAITVKTEFVPEVTPAKYRLFQAADFICTLELMRMRIAEGKGLNKSELAFFGNARLFKRNVLAQLSGKDF